MKELIARLRTDPIFDDSTLGNETADLLERLTSGDVSLPEQDHVIHLTDSETIDCFRKDQMQDYGGRRAAAAVLAERELRSRDIGTGVLGHGECAAAIRKGTP